MTFSTGLKRLACRLSLSVAYLAWGYAGLFLWILYLAYSGHLPDWFQAIPYYDKPAHGVLYAIAATWATACSGVGLSLSRGSASRGSACHFFPCCLPASPRAKSCSKGWPPPARWMELT